MNIQRVNIFLGLLLLLNVNSYAQTGLQFNNLDSLLTYAEQHSSTIKTGEQQALLAKWGKIASYANSLNLRNPLNFSLTNNTQLPVNFLPAEVFGGPPGTFRTIAFGQKYIGNFNVGPQIDIINVAAWEKIKAAGINKEYTSIGNLLVKKTLYESIAAAYYNIITLQEQARLTKVNLVKADSLLMTVKNKYDQGISRQQDVNDAQANQLSLEDALNQSQLSLEQQYLVIKVLCDFPTSTNLSIVGHLDYNSPYPASRQPMSQLQLKSSALQLQLAKSDLRFNRLSQWPMVSLFASYLWQQNSNNEFFEPDANWISSQYIGARITMNIPDVNKILLSRSAKINYNIARYNYEHVKISHAAENQRMQIDYQKAYSQFVTLAKIYKLKSENYSMAFQQYQEGILSFDMLLLAFNEMLSSHINFLSTTGNIQYQKAKIDLNNTIK